MRVALCSDTYHPIADGVARHLVDFKAELERRGHSVRVYTVFSNGDGVFGLPSYRFPLYREYRVGIPVYELYRDMERFKPDIVHIHTPFTLGIMGYRFAKKRKIPTVGTYHTDFVNMSNTLRYPFGRSLLNLGFQYNMHLYAKLDQVVSPSKVTAKRLEKFGNESKVIPVGIDLKRFSYEENKGDYYLFIGRITQDKGIMEILRAATTLPKKSFKIAGTGPLESIVREYAETYSNIEYLGHISEEEKIELLKRAKILVVPSRAETFGIALVEAMASGTPVIGSQESREIGILREDYNGWTVEYGNPSALIEKLKQLDERDLREYSRNALLSSNEYSIESTTSQLESLYGELIRSRA